MRGDLARYSDDLARVVAVARPSVMTVRTGHALGAGVMVAPKLVVTCWHVVRDGGAISVAGERTESGARLLAKDVGNDLALLETGQEAPVARFGSGVQAGAVVVAIGAPAGKARFVSVGAVARIGGIVEVDGGTRLLGAIEIDCRVRRGNSGGGLFDIEGRLVGILAAGRASDDTGAAVSVGRVLRLLEEATRRRTKVKEVQGIVGLQALFREAVRLRGSKI